MRARPAVLVFALLGSAAWGSSFESDFETGIPANGWSDLIAPSGEDSIAYVSPAAHRGARGMRVVDATQSSSQGGTAGVSENTGAPGQQTLFTRCWFRAPAFGNDAAGGSLAISQVIAPGSGVNSVLDLYVDPSSGQFGGAGPDVNGTYFIDRDTPSFDLAQWHLVEVALHGLGTTSGHREIFVDGQRSGLQTNLDWTGLSLLRVALGEPWANDRSLTATLDFDDFRMSDTPLASRLVLGRAEGGSASCAALSVGLQDVYGAAAAAPYDVEVALTAPSGARLYSDASCTRAVTSLTLSEGASTQPFYVAGGVPAGKLDATAVDFLAAETTLEKVGAGRETRLYDLGCSSTAEGPAWAAVLVLVLCGGHGRRRSAQLRSGRSST